MSSSLFTSVSNDVCGSRAAPLMGRLRRRLRAWVGATLAGAALASAAGASAATPASAGAPAITAALAAAATTATTASAPVTTSTGLVQMPDGRLLAPEFARIIGRGELVVAVLSVDQPPFFEERNGKLEGLDIDLAREMANKLHVKVRFNRDAHTFDDVVSLLARGQADIAVSKLSRTLTRATVIAFSSPYLRLNRALLLNRVKFAQLAHGRSVPEVVRSFDSTIGVVANSSYAGYVVNNFPRAQVRSYPTWDDVLKALNAGEITAAYRDEFEVKRVLKADPTASLRLRVVTLQDLEDTLAIGVNVNDVALLSFVNQFLSERSVKLDVSAVLQAADH
ncbi:substrate-binding periplasmic protein [Paraburkholderia lycopersici]|uniref:ABC-type amino acid transport substrate-binding protein n=1 Tax=Paraburkholderia lycopersici TaxID=416944 RepID=A0A1G6W9W9_9BURK|nr:ABC transporter substrate-binding protein [Paraburkholderia lycopersici]SDD62027.1 ABC-type amino acid transport substrate-binding protein [Paraburkholderia lycopersici]